VAALDRARRRSDIEWLLGRAEDAGWQGEFELAFMASNAFQVFVSDEELRASLSAIRRAVVDGGLFVFGTRNPLVREWEEWAASEPFDVIDHENRALRLSYGIEGVESDVVTLTETTATRSGEPVRVDRAQLRFLGVEQLRRFLGEAGFEVENVYGDWSKGPFTDGSRDIIVVARAVH
jgi:SAM-dependent methyltransferase